MSLEETLARAICNGFWETAESPMTWETTPKLKQDVFRICARRAIEAAKKFKAEQVGREAA